MPIHDALAHAPHRLEVASPHRPRECPLCQSMLLAPEATVFDDDSQVRHLWSCDDCGYAFCTSIRVAAGRIQARQI